MADLSQQAAQAAAELRRRADEQKHKVITQLHVLILDTPRVSWQPTLHCQAHLSGLCSHTLGDNKSCINAAQAALAACVGLR